APKLSLLTSPEWSDYELLDSGRGQRLERFGPYTFVRPEHQAIWQPALPEKDWQAAHAVFVPTGEESGGRWQLNQPVKTPWTLTYKGLRFLSFTANSRHVGFFPEQAAHWDWMRAHISKRISSRGDRPGGASGEPVRVLNLFGYTGLA